MNFNYRVKVLGCTVDQLLAMGHAVNSYECNAGEHWIIGCSQSQLEAAIQRDKLTIVSDYEAIR